MKELSDNATAGEKYDEAMMCQTVNEATRILTRNVRHTMKHCPDMTIEEATKTERSNIAYWAGYHDHETRVRVERLFNCVHPLLGQATERQMTPEEAFELGQRMGRRIRDGESFDGMTHAQPEDPIPPIEARKKRRFIDQSYADRACGADITSNQHNE